MSIGEVLTQLRGEFPDVTISKLRFLEAEGLVEPYRAPSGYRKYTAEHVEQLRFVLTAQRDRYLPLRVIREQLAGVGCADRVQTDRVASVAPAPRVGRGMSDEPSPMVTAVSREPGDARLTRAQLVERSGAAPDLVADLEQYGLVVVGPSGHYSAEALMITRLAAQLAEFGLHARHLRPYRATADREVGLLAQLVTPLARQSTLGGRAQALQTVHELAALCAHLHAALVRDGLRQVLGR